MTRSSSVEKGERKRHSISRERNAGTTGIDLSPAFVFGVFTVPSGSAERRTVIVAPSRAMSDQRRPRISPTRRPAWPASAIATD